jgi:hypothetical protein
MGGAPCTFLLRDLIGQVAWDRTDRGDKVWASLYALSGVHTLLSSMTRSWV